jgi:hypothetical protein
MCNITTYVLIPRVIQCPTLLRCQTTTTMYSLYKCILGMFPTSPDAKLALKSRSSHLSYKWFFFFKWATNPTQSEIWNSNLLKAFSNGFNKAMHKGAMSQTYHIQSHLVKLWPSWCVPAHASMSIPWQNHLYAFSEHIPITSRHMAIYF